MNIFEILASGNRGLKEEHISAALGWLFDPYHDHGLGLEVLKRTVSRAFPGSRLNKTIESQEYSGLKIRERSQLDVDIELEKAVVYDERSRSIDIVIDIDGDYLVAVENKITDGSMQKNQILEEAAGLLQHEDAKGKNLFFIYLIPQAPSKEAERELAKMPAETTSAILAWRGPGSMAEILREILAADSQGNISALSTETRFILKSFIRFIENGFSYYQWNGKTPGEKEYDEVLQDIFEVVDKGRDGFIGYYGGMKVLLNDLEDAKTDLAKRERLLSNRPYKWAVSCRGKKENWIPTDDFVSQFRRAGILG